MSKSLLVYISLLLFALDGCVAEAQSYGAQGGAAQGATEWEKTKEALGDIEPGDDAFRHSATKDNRVYRHAHYKLSYSEADEQAEWVSYDLTGEEAMSKTVGKNSEFAEDPDVVTGSAQPINYRGTGYDKGHLAPSADMRFDATAQKECFYMSNMSPQLHCFNAGIWNDLEDCVRRWAKAYKHVYVVTGPVLPKAKEKLSWTDKNGVVRKNKVTVPEYFYKIVFDYTKPDKAKMIAFLMPNKCGETGGVMEYATNVREIELLTGIDFFSNLPKDVQDYLETRYDIGAWK